MIKILIVGAGGYGQGYVDAMLNQTDPEVKLEGIVEPFLDRAPHKEAILAANIPVYNTMEEFYAEHRADLALIATPTFLHCEQSILALQHGTNVLCEKPAASTVSETEKMIAAEKEYGHFIGIGYQWSYLPENRELKQDILDGKLGKPLSLKNFVSWPRTKSYYARGGGWGGRISKNGKVVLDSIVSNACAHYLHNMLYITGSEMGLSKELKEVEAECFRAHDIENFDTCVIRGKTEDGIKVYFAGTHAGGTTHNPEFIYTFENAVVECREALGDQIVATFADGTKKTYGNYFSNSMQKLADAIECTKNGTRPVCTVVTASAHTRLINELYKNVEIVNFPGEMITRDEENVTVTGLYEKLYKAYQEEAMLSESGYDFARCASFTTGKTELL